MQSKFVNSYLRAIIDFLMYLDQQIVFSVSVIVFSWSEMNQNYSKIVINNAVHSDLIKIVISRVFFNKFSLFLCYM